MPEVNIVMLEIASPVVYILLTTLFSHICLVTHVHLLWSNTQGFLFLCELLGLKSSWAAELQKDFFENISVMSLQMSWDSEAMKFLLKAGLGLPHGFWAPESTTFI